MAVTPSISLKVIFTVHLLLTVWASMMNVFFLPTSYIYMNAFVLAFGALAIAQPEGSEALLMFFITNVAAILTDVIFLSIYAPRSPELKNNSEYSFCLAMAIINLLVRPCSSFILFRLYQERNGQYSDFGIPNITGLPGFGSRGSPSHGTGYENIDQPSPSNNIETAAPHSTIEKTLP